MGGKTKIKKLDSFQPVNDFLLTRSLIPRIGTREEINELLNDRKGKVVFDYEKVAEKIKKNRSNLFYRGKITDSFFTEDSKLYITPKELKLVQKGIKLNRNANNWDGLSKRIVDNYKIYQKKENDALLKALAKRYELLKDNFSETSQAFIGTLTPARAWNLSIIGAILFGMFSMTLIYRYLGEGVSADRVRNGDNPQVQEMQMEDNKEVLGVEDLKDEETKYIEELMKDEANKTKDELNQKEAKKREELEKEIRQMVKGYPIERMVPYIAEKDRIVAAFLVGIARKESGWGNHVPVYKGNDCHNLWGYRGKNPVGSGGHSCFLSEKDAVDTVAKRIEYLVEKEGLNTPAKMSIWKCGSGCHKDKQVKKWISDVELYFDKLNK